MKARDRALCAEIALRRSGTRGCYRHAITKADLHELVDSLPDESLDAAGVLLRRAQDPVVAVLETAPYDDEPYTMGDQEAVEHSLQEERVSWEEAKTELEAD